MVNYHIQNGNLKARKVLGIYTISSVDLDSFFSNYFYSKRYENKSNFPKKTDEK
jgi:hypothetical protein